MAEKNISIILLYTLYFHDLRKHTPLFPSFTLSESLRLDEEKSHE
jgi:hypothetical protein